MENKIDSRLAEKIKNAKRIRLEVVENYSSITNLELEPFTFKHIASALKSALIVKERELKRMTKRLYQ